MKRVKIIATIHPRDCNNKKLNDIVKAGADILRINTKYISIEKYVNISKKARKIKNCKLMVDIKNRKILNKLLDKDFDYLAISFAEDSNEIKKIKKMFSKKIKIISKIESKKGVKNINSLINVSDGIMIARGDLGKSFPIEQIPLIQKSITKKCNKKRKMSITATEMMPSMVTYMRPSRAEVSDIVNAILEGSEALLLAEETAIGNHPILAIKTMKKIIKEVEKRG